MHLVASVRLSICPFVCLYSHGRTVCLCVSNQWAYADNRAYAVNRRFAKIWITWCQKSRKFYVAKILCRENFVFYSKLEFKLSLNFMSWNSASSDISRGFVLTFQYVISHRKAKSELNILKFINLYLSLVNVPVNFWRSVAFVAFGFLFAFLVFLVFFVSFSFPICA